MSKLYIIYILQNKQVLKKVYNQIEPNSKIKPNIYNI